VDYKNMLALYMPSQINKNNKYIYVFVVVVSTVECIKNKSFFLILNKVILPVDGLCLLAVKNTE